MSWVKGKSGNPKGRPRVLLPEVQKAIDQNKNVSKMIILKYLFQLTEVEMQERQRRRDLLGFEKGIGAIVERIILDGDIVKMRLLLEMVFGKIPNDKDSERDPGDNRPFKHLTDEQLDAL